MEFLQQLIEKGGIVMYPLFFLSLSGTYLIFRGLYIYRPQFIFPERSRLNWKNYGASSLGANPAPIPQIRSHGDHILSFLFADDLSPIHDKHIEDELSKLRFKLENPLELLENIAAVAPLFGLAGTVLGIIRIFRGRALADVSTLTISQGISEALFTTITGLFIAIPCIVFHNILRRQLNMALIHTDSDIRSVIKKCGLPKTDAST